MPMWFVVLAAVASLFGFEFWTSRVKQRERRNASKRLVESRINSVLMVYGSFAGLDAPETTRVLALRAAVRQGKLLPVGECSTTAEADRWVDQNLVLMSKAHPQKVEELAAPERASIKAAMKAAEAPKASAD